MFYPFPADLTLAETREVVARHNANLGSTIFIEADRGEHAIFNYLISVPDGFPQPDTGDPAIDRDRAIVRECRGLVFCVLTGEVVARRFHKFFNVNEKAFTQSHLIDWSQPHVVLEKLDGSMITPILSAAGLRWGTKMGLTDVAQPVEEFVQAHPAYAALAHHLIATGSTPLFEWCSRKQQIVIDYPQDDLVLTAVRDNRTGAYLGYAALCALAESFGVSVVRALPGSIESIERFMAETADLEGAEGYIIAFENGHRLKVKGRWYCAIHGSKDAIRLEKDVLGLILADRIDDILGFLTPDDRDRIARYTKALDEKIRATAERLSFFVEVQRTTLAGDAKRFALDVAPHLVGADRSLCFAMWNGRDPVETVRNHVARNVSTGPKVEAIRGLIDGLHWDDYRDRVADDL